MGFLIPGSEISKGDLKALRAEIVENLLDVAVAETGKKRSEFVVRDAFPKDDFGFAGCEWDNQAAIGTADTWESDWTKELPDNKFVCFYGVLYHELDTMPAAADAEGPALKGVSYRVGSAGATVREQIHIQSMHRIHLNAGGDGPFAIGYHKPVYYKAEETINVYLISNATPAAYAEDIELLCMVCEPFGEVVSGVYPKRSMEEQTSMIIPFEDMTVEDIKALREEAKETLLALAMKETGKPAEELVIRDIFPKDDFSFAGVEWQNQLAINAADTWENDWSKELPKTKFVVFFGVHYPISDATPTAWKFMGVSYKLGSAGATTLKQVHIQKCQRYGLVEGATAADVEGKIPAARGYHRPVYYKGTDYIYISLIANATVTQYYEKIQLLGLICEPYGATISGK